MQILDYLLHRYGTNEPILLDEMADSIEKQELYHRLPELLQTEQMKQFSEDVIYIPTDTIFGKSILSTSKVITRKYINRDGITFGYYTKVTLQNRLHLSTQVPMTLEIATNKEASEQNAVIVGKQNVILYRPKTPVTSENHHVLMLLDAIEFLSKNDQSIDDDTVYFLRSFMNECHINSDSISTYLNYYSEKTKSTFYKMNL